MMHRRLLACLTAVALCTGGPIVAKAPQNWDGLVRTKAKKMEYVYLLPGADFSGYTKVMLDAPEVAFEKDWQRDYNRDTRSLSRRVSDKDIRDAIDQGRQMLDDEFRQGFEKAGFQVVTAPDTDVLRVSVGVANVRVVAPDIVAPGRSTTISREAGSATLIVEVRDSLSGQLMGRAVDPKLLDDTIMFVRTSVSNRADFQALFARWARMSAEGLNILKATPPMR